MENFVLYEELNRDEYCIIYKGRRKGTINFVAIHCVEKCKRPEVTNTVRMTHDISHKNVVQFYEWYETSNHLWLIVELCTGGSLEAIISQDGYLPESSVRVFGQDLVCGLYYLHSIGILFCDLHSSKILLDGSGTLKFADFGLSRVEEENLDDLFHRFMDGSENDQGDDQVKFSTLGCLRYTAPEVITSLKHTMTSDLWALGCLLYEMFTGHSPFVDDDDEKLREKILNHEIPVPKVKGTRFSSKPSPDFWHLLQALLQRDPVQRLTWHALIEHPFWEGVLRDVTESTTTMTSHDPLVSDSANDAMHGLAGEEGITDGDISMLGKTDCDDPVRPQSSLLGGDLISTSRPGSVIGDHMRPKTAQETDGATGLFTLSSRPHTATPPDEVDSPHRPLHSPLITTRQPLRGESDSSLSYLKSLLYHPLDFVTTQIVDNHKIQKPVSMKYDSKILPVPPFSVDKLAGMSDKDSNKHMKMVMDAVTSPEKGPPSQKRIHLLNYLTTLAASKCLSPLLVAHDAIVVIAKLIKDTNNTDIRTRLARILALVALNAEEVATDCNLSEVFSHLSELTRDNVKITPLRESLLIAIGQLLCLVANQEIKLGESVEKWRVPSMTYTLITRSLRDTDGVINHIAAKTIENVTVTDTAHTQKFITNETAQLVWCVYKNSTSDPTRTTALAALCHMTCWTPALFQSVIDTVGLAHIMDHLKPPVNHQHTALVTMFGSLVTSHIHLNRFIQHKDFVERLVRLLDTPSFVLRAKIYLILRELIAHNFEVLLPCCLNRFVFYVERDVHVPNKGDNSDPHDYLTQCVMVVIPAVIKAVPDVMSQTVSVLAVTQGRQHPPTSHIKLIKASLPMVAVISHIVPTTIFGVELLTPDFVQSTFTLLTYLLSIERGDSSVQTSLGENGLADLNASLLSVLGQLSRQPSCFLDNVTAIRDQLIPTLCGLVVTPTLDIKVARLHSLSQIVAGYMSHMTNQRDDLSFHETLTNAFYPQVEQLLLDQHPVPGYVLKLLSFVTSAHTVYVSHLFHHNLVPLLFHVWTDLNTGSVTSTLDNLVSVVRTVVHHGNTSLHQFYDLGLIDLLTTGLYDVTNTMFDAATPPEGHVTSTLVSLLDILNHGLRHVSDVVRKALQIRKGEGGDSGEEAEDLLLTNKPLTDLVSLQIRLACNEDADIRDVAVKCLSLLVQLYGGENQAALERPNMDYYSEALMMADSRKQKVLLRIIKRLITTNKDHLECMKSAGTTLRATIGELAKAASSHADMAVANLASEILNTLT